MVNTLTNGPAGLSAALFISTGEELSREHLKKKKKSEKKLQMGLNRV